jgi:hypothetical protein
MIHENQVEDERLPDAHARLRFARFRRVEGIGL